MEKVIKPHMLSVRRRCPLPSRARHQQRMAARRSEETAKQSQDRRARNQERILAHRSQETPAQVNTRQTRNRESMANCWSEERAEQSSLGTEQFWDNHDSPEANVGVPNPGVCRVSPEKIQSDTAVVWRRPKSTSRERCPSWSSQVC